MKRADLFRSLLAAIALTQPATLFDASRLPAAVEVHAHYNLKGAGGIPDTACPELLKDQAGNSPDLKRQGSPKVMSSGPEERREEYDSAIKFEEPDQCYNVATNLVNGDNFVVEAWASALQGEDGGWHTVVANGHGGVGFLIAQHDRHWAVLVGGIGSVNLGQVEPASWTHLAVVKRDGQATGWLNVREAARLPDMGGGVPNFAIGATAPGRESFRGWIAEVRYSTFQPGQFDPMEDFLSDNPKRKAIQAAEMAVRAKLVESLFATPGVLKVSKFDEHPAMADWLIEQTTPAQ